MREWECECECEWFVDGILSGFLRRQSFVGNGMGRVRVYEMRPMIEEGRREKHREK